MRPDVGVAIAFIICVSWIGVSIADTEILTLRNNPFSRPEIVKAPPPAPAPVFDPLARGDQIELKLTATMVSDTTPMAVVDGELIGIGDRIQGLKLIAVMEGKVVFRGKGRKFTFEIDKIQPKQGPTGSGF